MADILPITRPTVNPPTEPAGLPLVADAMRLAALLGLGLRTIRSHDAAGKLPKPLKIGGRVVWRVDEIRLWLAAGAPDRETWEACKSASRK